MHVNSELYVDVHQGVRCVIEITTTTAATRVPRSNNHPIVFRPHVYALHERTLISEVKVARLNAFEEQSKTHLRFRSYLVIQYDTLGDG